MNHYMAHYGYGEPCVEKAAEVPAARETMPEVAAPQKDPYEEAIVRAAARVSGVNNIDDVCIGLARAVIALRVDLAESRRRADETALLLAEMAKRFASNLPRAPRRTVDPYTGVVVEKDKSEGRLSITPACRQCARGEAHTRKTNGPAATEPFDDTGVVHMTQKHQAVKGESI